MSGTDDQASVERKTDPADAGAASSALPVLRSCYADHKAVRRVLPLFVNDLPTQVASMKTQLGEGNLPAVRRLVHGLRGSGGGYGFPDITRVATTAETTIDLGADLEGIHRAVEELIELVRRVEGYDRSHEVPGTPGE